MDKYFNRDNKLINQVIKLLKETGYHPEESYSEDELIEFVNNLGDVGLLKFPVFEGEDFLNKRLIMQIKVWNLIQ